MTMRGPTDPDLYRRKVGRYGDRWYVDPLPGCEFADATDEAWPSVSLIKKAWPSDFSNYAVAQTAEYAWNHYDTLHALDREGAIAAMKKARYTSMDRAANRGTVIHELLETLADGREPDPILNEDAIPYVPAAMALLEDLRPEWLLSEAVAISRTYKVGGTLDAAWYIPKLGITALVDFKTRAKHQAYDVEVAQCGGYFVADYVIVTDDNGHPVRRPLPEFDTAMIITITPDGFRCHPIEVEGAKRTFISLRDFWNKQREGRKAIGSPLILPPAEEANEPISDPINVPVPRPAEPPSSAEVELLAAVEPELTVEPEAAAVEDDAAPSVPDSISMVIEAFGAVEVVESGPGVQAWLVERATALAPLGGLEHLARIWPAGVPTFRECRELDYLYTADQAQEVHEALSAAEAHVQAPFPSDDPRVPAFQPKPAPPEPEPLRLVPGDAPVVLRLKDLFAGLAEDQRKAIADLQVREKIPALTSGKATRGQVARIAIQIRQAIRERDRRAERMRTAVGELGQLGFEPTDIRLFLDTVGQHTGVPCTALMVETFAAVVDWAVVGNLAIVDGAVVVTKQGTVALIEFGKREAVAAAKRALADTVDAALAPTKFDDLIALPALAAWVHTILINTADQEATAA